MLTYRSYCTFLIINAALICLINAHLPTLEKCPDIKAITDFDAEQYLGKWYEYEKNPFIFELGGRCNYAMYEKTSNNTVISVLNSQISFFNIRTNIAGTGTLNEDPRLGKLLVQFNIVPIKPTTPNYWILGTDYTTYSVVASCNFLNLNSLNVWVLTRERIPTEETIKKIDEVLQANQISKERIVKTTQTDCPSD